MIWLHRQALTSSGQGRVSSVECRWQRWILTLVPTDGQKVEALLEA
jgi:hypothetical protein